MLDVVDPSCADWRVVGGLVKRLCGGRRRGEVWQRTGKLVLVLVVLVAELVSADQHAGLGVACVPSSVAGSGSLGTSRSGAERTDVLSSEGGGVSAGCCGRRGVGAGGGSSR